jgi:hypothetical protein
LFHGRCLPCRCYVGMAVMLDRGPAVMTGLGPDRR